MTIIFSKLKKKRSGKVSSVRTAGTVYDLLILLVSITKNISEILSKQEKINLEESENFIVDFIKNGLKTIKK